jgi:hypothetical protein
MNPQAVENLPTETVRALSGLTVADVARRYRVSPDKVRQWIKNGELSPALNTASTLCGRPRWVVTPEALAKFEKQRQAPAAPKPARRKKRSCPVDYFPD